MWRQKECLAKLQHHLANSSLHDSSRAIMSLDEIANNVEVLQEDIDSSLCFLFLQRPASTPWPTSGRPPGFTVQSVSVCVGRVH